MAQKRYESHRLRYGTIYALIFGMLKLSFFKHIYSYFSNIYIFVMTENIDNFDFDLFCRYFIAVFKTHNDYIFD